MQSLFDFVTYTKGIEYLIAVGFLFVFIWFWRFAKGGELVTVQVEEAERVRVPRLLEDIIGGFLLPKEVYYHQGHTWVKPEVADVVTVGLDDFAQKLVGKIDGIKFPALGTQLKQGEKGLTMMVNSKPLDLLSPVDGEVVAVNSAANESTNRVNVDPYGKGWLFKVRAPKFDSNRSGLLSGELAKRWLDEERGKLMARVAPAVGAVALDAGPATSGIAQRVAGENWDELAREFLLVK